MGKRSSFDRVEKDFYETIDKRAVDILSPFLNSIDGYSTYAEPCWGMGALERQLHRHGYQCLWASDLAVPPEYGVVSLDALQLTEDHLRDCSLIITNPPWSRPILHKMIEHFANLRPTWLLFDADWMHTKQSAELMNKYCTHIVSVGRLIWIPGTTMSGKDNCAWYRFDKHKLQDTIFHGRNLLA